ncbi:hypothetical protein [Nibricoccus sp. IMCC34717]|uniref:hypothetical protein n=1 Tax=Nibricoccus sp. IMCC34717 TaxID=3034021 RepID=UPI00384E167C
MSTSAAQSRELPPNLFGTLPPDVAAMVRDDAYLSMARQALSTEVADLRDQVADARRITPLLPYLLDRRVREKRRVRVEHLSRRLHETSQLAQRVRTLRERLAAPLRAAIAHHLGNCDAGYRQGLRGSRYHEHWRRRHTVVEDRLRGFLRDLKDWLAAVEDDLEHKRPRMSGQTQWKLTSANAAAHELEQAIEDLNHVSDLHASALNDTPFEEVRLPRIEPWACITPLAEAASKQLLEARAYIEHLIQDFSTNKEQVLATIDVLFRDAASLHSSIAENRLVHSWTELQLYAETYLVSEEAVEPMVAEIEQRQNEAERARIMRQLAQRPDYLHRPKEGYDLPK